MRLSSERQNDTAQAKKERELEKARLEKEAERRRREIEAERRREAEERKRAAAEQRKRLKMEAQTAVMEERKRVELEAQQLKERKRAEDEVRRRRAEIEKKRLAAEEEEAMRVRREEVGQSILCVIILVVHIVDKRAVKTVAHIVGQSILCVIISSPCAQVYDSLGHTRHTNPAIRHARTHAYSAAHKGKRLLYYTTDYTAHLGTRDTLRLLYGTLGHTHTMQHTRANSPTILYYHAAHQGTLHLLHHTRTHCDYYELKHIRAHFIYRPNRVMYMVGIAGVMGVSRPCSACG